MEWREIAGPLVGAGATVLGTIIGGPVGVSVGNVVGQAVAGALGVPPTPKDVVEAIRTDPAAGDKLMNLEDERAGEWAAIAADGMKLMQQLAGKESAEGFFAWGWRPAMSWLVGAMAAQTFIVAPWAKAIGGFDIAVPYEQVLGFAGIWLTIYGGGHTFKAIFGSRVEAK